MTSRMALSELEALVKQCDDDDELYAMASGQYPVAWLNGRLMVGFLGSVASETVDFGALQTPSPQLHVGAQRGSIVSFRIDIHHLDMLEGLGLSAWQLAGKAAPDLEKARYGTRADSVQAGLGLPQAFTGEDVLIGVVDWGFDYTHPMFYDAGLNASRIRGFRFIFCTSLLCTFSM